MKTFLQEEKIEETPKEETLEEKESPGEEEKVPEVESSGTESCKETESEE